MKINIEFSTAHDATLDEVRNAFDGIMRRIATGRRHGDVFGLFGTRIGKWTAQNEKPEDAELPEEVRS